MAEFNAGSIVAELDVDRRPFERGLDAARRQADEFSGRSYTSTLDIDTRVAAAELDAFERRLRSIRNPTIHPDVDTRVAAEELRLLEQRIREATRDRTIIIRTQNVGTPGNGNGGPGGGGAGGAGGAGGGLGLAGALIPLIGSILPAIVPLTTAATGLGAALAGGFTMGALAIGSFAVVAKSDLAEVSKAMKKVGGDATKLPAQLQPLGMALEQLHYSLAVLKNQTSGAVNAALTQGVHTLTSGMALAAPLINATARGLQMMFAIFQNFVQGSAFKNFVDLTRREIGPALTGIGVIIVNIANAALRMFEIFNPILILLGRAAVDLSGKIDAWSRNGGLDKFAKTVYSTLGPVINFLKAFVGALASIWRALGTGGGSSLTFLTTLLNAIKQLQPALTAIVQLFSPFELLIEKALPSLIPFVNLLGQLAQAIIPLLNATVQGLVDGLQGVIKVLTPVVNALIEFFHKIGPADKILGFIIAGFIGLKVALIALRAAAAANPIILLLTALAALAVVIVDHWKGFSKFWIDLWHDVSRYFQTAIRDIVGAWHAVARFFERIWHDIYGFFKHYGAIILAVLLPFIGLPVLIAQHWRQIVGWLKKVWDDVWRDVKGVWGAVIRFFERIPGWIVGVFSTAGKWLLHAGAEIINGLWNGIKAVWAIVIGFYEKVYSVILHFFASAASWLLHAGMEIITGLWNGIKIVWQSVLGFYSAVYGAILRFFSNAISWLIDAGKNILTGLWNGIRQVWDDVTGWFGNLWHNITDFFAGAGDWLIDAGKAIIGGLWNGIKQVWHDLTGWLGSVGGWIKNLKGPLDKDRQLLIPEGMAIMQGFHQGLRDTFDNLVAPYLSDVGANVQGAFGGLKANAKLSTSSSIVSAATVRISEEQRVQTRQLMDRVDKLANAVAGLPAATGKAVGDSVGNIDKATAKQTRDLVTAARTA